MIKALIRLINRLSQYLKASKANRDAKGPSKQCQECHDMGLGV